MFSASVSYTYCSCEVKWEQPNHSHNPKNGIKDWNVYRINKVETTEMFQMKPPSFASSDSFHLKSSFQEWNFLRFLIGSRSPSGSMSQWEMSLLLCNPGLFQGDDYTVTGTAPDTFSPSRFGAFSSRTADSCRRVELLPHKSINTSDMIFTRSDLAAQSQREAC